MQEKHEILQNTKGYQVVLRTTLMTDNKKQNIAHHDIDITNIHTASIIDKCINSNITWDQYNKKWDDIEKNLRNKLKKKIDQKTRASRNCKYMQR